MLFEIPNEKQTKGTEPRHPAALAFHVKNLLPVDNKIQAVLELLPTESNIHWVSAGDWNMHHLLVGILDITGAAHVTISSYAFGEQPTRIIADLRQRQIIKSLRVLVDSRIESRNASSLTMLENVCDKFKLANTHAKITIVETDQMQFVVVGSANYSTNRRYETGFISQDAQVVDFHKKWINNELDT